MSTVPPNLSVDDDPNDIMDDTDLHDEGSEDEVLPLAPVDPPISTELTPELEEELRRAMVTDEVEESSAVKAKGHMLPEELIKKPLNPAEDLWSEDSISI